MNFFERLSYWWRTKRWRTPDEERGWRVVGCMKAYTTSDFKDSVVRWYEIEFFSAYCGWVGPNNTVATIYQYKPFLWRRGKDGFLIGCEDNACYRFDSLDEAFDFASKHFAPTARVHAR